MLINIRYFGMLVEITNTEQETFSKETNSCLLKDICKEITNKYPKLLNSTYNIAVNQKIAQDQTIINNGDELAFLPPFAGG